MKKILFVLVVILTLSRCTTERGKTIDNPKQFTTVEKLELPRDTIVVAIKDGSVYIFQDNIIVDQAKFIDYNKITALVFIFVVIILILCIIIKIIIEFKPQ